MKKISTFWITIAFAAGGVALIKQMGALMPPFLHMQPIDVNPLFLGFIFLAGILFTGPVFRLLKAFLIFGFFTPVFFSCLQSIMVTCHVNMDPTILWVLRGFALSLATTTYLYGFKILKWLAYKTLWYIFSPIRYIVRKIGPTFNFFWRKIKKVAPCPIDLSLSDVDKLGNGDTYEKGRQFEEYISQLYRVMGYDAKTTTQLRLEGKLPPSIQGTGGSGEQGVDVVVSVFDEKSGKERRIIIQCKHYSQKVENKAVQEIHTAKAMYDGELAVVITNNYFTKQAQNLAAVNGVKLINRDELAQLIKNATRKYYEQHAARNEKPQVDLAKLVA